MYNKEFAKNLIDQIPDDQMQAVVSYLQNTAKDFCGSSTASIKNQAPEKPASKEQTDIRKSSITSKIPVSLNNKTILVTGAAGFIGFHLIKRLSALCTGSTLIGVDNLNDYYDPALKEWRIRQLQSHTGSTGCQFNFKKASIADKAVLSDIFRTCQPQIVVNLAAQAGVRYSITNPDAYIESNLTGFYNILEACRHDDALEHLVYASSSSVYGGSEKIPFSTSDPVDHPVSLYAATKKSNELLAHSYARLYDIPCTGLRFFTVYGPAGRPDMAYYSFTEKLRAGSRIQIFNYGNCKRDFTYIDDIVEGIVRVMQGAPARQTGADGLPVPPYSIYNIGGGQPENLMDFVHILSEELIRAGALDADFHIEDYLDLVPMQPGDVPVTYADSSGLEKDYGFRPQITLREGLGKFAAWYKSYYCE